LLAEFGSVVDAVACAVALQRGMVERNKGIGEDRRIDVRIGVNLGDVIIEGEDRHGEGVNIAVRLEQLSEPGGICISQQAYDQVESKLRVGSGQGDARPHSDPASEVRRRSPCGVRGAPDAP
jgi:adenylate cyclase